MRGAPIERIAIAEFRRLGFLQEVNRCFLHPLGLALEVVVDDDGTERLGGVWDYRDDPEGMMFADPPDEAKAAHVALEAARHSRARRAMIPDIDAVPSLLVIQPTGWAPPASAFER